MNTYKILNKEGILEDVVGKPIDIVPYLKTFIYKSLKIKGWIITETSTGTLLGQGITQARAKEIALGYLEGNGGKVKALEAINEHIKKHGIANEEVQKPLL